MKIKSNYYLLNLRNTDIFMQFCTLCTLFRNTETSNSSERWQGKDFTITDYRADLSVLALM